MAKQDAKPTGDVAEEPIAQEPVTEEQLKAELQTALDSGDFKAVAQVSRKIDTIQKGKEKAELEAKRALLEGMSNRVKDILMTPITALIEAGELDAADGIWFSYDFGDGEKTATLRLLKTTTRAPRAGGGGTGKKFDVSTDALLAKYGGEPYKETGMDFKTAYDSNTDKNWRYAIRQALLKKDGII